MESEDEIENSKFVVIYWLGSNTFSTITYDKSLFSSDSPITVNAHAKARTSTDTAEFHPCHVWYTTENESNVPAAERQIELAINSFPWSREKCVEFDDSFCGACLFRNASNPASTSAAEPAPPAAKRVRVNKSRPDPEATVIATASNVRNDPDGPISTLSIDTSELTAEEAAAVARDAEIYAATGQVPEPPAEPSLLEKLLAEVKGVKAAVKDHCYTSNTYFDRVNTKLDKMGTRIVNIEKRVENIEKRVENIEKVSSPPEPAQPTSSLRSVLRESIANEMSEDNILLPPGHPQPSDPDPNHHVLMDLNKTKRFDYFVKYDQFALLWY